MHGAKLPANINVVLPRGGARRGGESDAPTGRDAAEYRELWRAADALAVACPAAANAGEPIIPEEHLDRDSEKYYLFRRRFLENINRTGNFICIVVDLKEGRSMHPTLAPGDLLLVDRNLATYMQSQRGADETERLDCAAGESRRPGTVRQAHLDRLAGTADRAVG